MRLQVAILVTDDNNQERCVTSGMSVSSDGPEVTGHKYVEVGLDVVRMIRRTARILALEVPCGNCSAPIGSECYPEWGCTYEDRYRLRDIGETRAALREEK